jgi:hypothetical protein
MLPADTRPEPVYQLHWRDRSRYGTGGDPVNALLDVTLERVTPAPWQAAGGDQIPQAESLRIASVDGLWNGQRVTLNDIDLSLCTLESDAHWLDAATFQILWPS